MGCKTTGPGWVPPHPLTPPSPPAKKRNGDSQTCRSRRAVRPNFHPAEKVTQRRRRGGAGQGGEGTQGGLRGGAVRSEEPKKWGLGGGMSLSEQLLEETLLLGLVVLGARRSGGLLRGCGPDRALVNVRVTPDQVHCALDICKHLHLLHLSMRKQKFNLILIRPHAGAWWDKKAASYGSKAPTCWSLHTEPTLLRLLLLMATGCPIGGNELTPLEPPAMETVMLMLL